MAVTNLLAQSCNKVDHAIKLVTTTGNKQCEHNLLTACEQTCNNLFASLLEAVRFYACKIVICIVIKKSSFIMLTIIKPFQKTFAFSYTVHVLNPFFFCFESGFSKVKSEIF
jgi:hypothetical protein